jgi:phage baseplate assembly protein W
MAKDFLGCGWKFPVQVSPTTGRIEISKYEQDVREAIWIILSTAKGERVMRPDFGCGIHDLVFDPVSAATVGEVENNVREALINWEPRIEIINLEVSDQESFNGKLLINIDYRVRSTNNEFNLVYPFYFSEGA